MGLGEPRAAGYVSRFRRSMNMNNIFRMDNYDFFDQSIGQYLSDRNAPVAGLLLHGL